MTRHLGNGKGEKGRDEGVVIGRTASCKPKPCSRPGSSGAQAGSGGGQGDFSTWGACSLLLPSVGSFGAGRRSHWEKMQPFNPSLSKDQHLWGKEQNHMKGTGHVVFEREIHVNNSAPSVMRCAVQPVHHPLKIPHLGSGQTAGVWVWGS